MRDHVYECVCVHTSHANGSPLSASAAPQRMHLGMHGPVDIHVCKYVYMYVCAYMPKVVLIQPWDGA